MILQLKFIRVFTSHLPQLAFSQVYSPVFHRFIHPFFTGLFEVCFSRAIRLFSHLYFTGLFAYFHGLIHLFLTGYFTCFSQGCPPALTGLFAYFPWVCSHVFHRLIYSIHMLFAGFRLFSQGCSLRFSGVFTELFTYFSQGYSPVFHRVIRLFFTGFIHPLLIGHPLFTGFFNARIIPGAGLRKRREK